ncbi:hypothetical protein B296_00004796, partial [Ensete ventricosum]
FHSLVQLVKMKRMVSRKSHSWWWDSHISRKNSKWLEDNLEKMDQSVKQMLKLIEEEGESFAKKAEMYYQRRPELISHVEDFYRMYRALAERYDQVTGDLRKNIRSELRSQVSGSGSDHVSDPPSPSSIHSLEVTPESKPQQPKPRAAGFDFFLGSGGSSDLSRKGSDGSYSSSSECDSESEFDDANEVNGDGVSSRRQQKIHELEDELREMREKLNRQGENICHDHCNSKILSLEEDLSTANEKLHSAEAEIMVLKNKLEETNISLEMMETELRSEKEKVLDLDEHVAMLQNAALAYKYEIVVLKEATEATTKQFQTELLNRDIQIQEFKTELVDSKEKFLQQKFCLEAGIAYLEDVNMELKAETEKMLLEKLSLESHLSELQVVIQELQVSTSSSIENVLREKLALQAEVLALSQSNASLEGKINILDDRIRQLDADRIQACEESGKHITELNKKLDALKLQVDMLTAERDQLTAKVDPLTNDVRSRDGQINQMDEHLHWLQLEHVKLIIELEEARKASLDLKSRIKELEEEVSRQKVVISDGAEGKREAIRQLCFSIEHYRDGYHQLRQLLQCHRRSAIAAS